MVPLINMDGVGGFVGVSVCWHSVYACVCVFAWFVHVCLWRMYVCSAPSFVCVLFSVLEKSDIRCKYKAKLSSGILPCTVTEESERIGRHPGTTEMLPTTTEDVHMAEAVMSHTNTQLLQFRNSFLFCSLRFPHLKRFGTVCVSPATETVICSFSF